MFYWVLGIWLCGLGSILARHIYLGSRMLRNLAPGVRPGYVVAYRRRIMSVDEALFDTTGKRYRLMLARNEALAISWMLVGGVVLAILNAKSRSMKI